MNFAWYLGFNWLIVILLAALGFASWYYSEGWLHWLFYGLFALGAAYAVTRFRLYKREPWRRVHHRSFEIIRNYINANIKDGAKKDARIIARQLAETLWEGQSATVVPDVLVTEAGRKAYYRQLVEDYPVVFMQKIPAEKQQQAQASLLKDIEASEFSPDIVITVTIEKQYGRLEAARYLLAMASGNIK